MDCGSVRFLRLFSAGSVLFLVCSVLFCYCFPHWISIFKFKMERKSLKNVSSSNQFAFWEAYSTNHRNLLLFAELEQLPHGNSISGIEACAWWAGKAFLGFASSSSLLALKNHKNGTARGASSANKNPCRKPCPPGSKRIPFHHLCRGRQRV